MSEHNWDAEVVDKLLGTHPQYVTVDGVSYLCYAKIDGFPSMYVATRDDCHRTFTLCPLTKQAEEVTPSASPIALSQWHTSAEDLLARMKRCKENDARAAVAQMFTAGIALPQLFCVDLQTLLLRRLHNAQAKQLTQEIAGYLNDTPGSPRLEQACAQALNLLLSVRR